MSAADQKPFALRQTTRRGSVRNPTETVTERNEDTKPRQKNSPTRRRSVRNRMKTVSNRDSTESTEDTKTHKRNSSPRARDFTYNESNGDFEHFDRGFVRWIILLLALFGIGRAIYSMISYSKAGDASSEQPLASEQQIAELEGSAKKASKMFEAQLESLDTKYAKELDGVKEEVKEKIKKRASKFDIDLSNIRKHTHGMEKTLKQLKAGRILSRDEIQEIVYKISKAQAAIGDGQVLSLNDVKNVAKQLVEEEIERHSADGFGMVDFAIKSHGSKVVKHSKGLNQGRRFGCGLFTYFGRNSALHPHASKMLEPSFGEPGHCLPLKGSRVFVDISLPTSFFVNAMTLEHAAKSVADDRSSAPKTFRIFGWLSDSKKDQNTKEVKQMFLLGEFTYDLEKKNVQTFNLPLQSTTELVNMIKLDVLSNHGSHSRTCIYRLRVHGSESIHNVIKG